MALNSGARMMATGSSAALNIDTGEFLTEGQLRNFQQVTKEEDGVNPSPVEGSDFIDGVFFMNQDAMSINSADVEFEFEPGDAHVDGSWSGIYSNFTHQFSDGVRFIEVAGMRGIETGVGMHAAVGMTFDLAAIRETHGNSAVEFFSTFAGRDGCPNCEGEPAAGPHG